MAIKDLVVTRSFPKQILIDNDLPHEGNDEFEIVEDNMLYNTRWSLMHELIFKHEDKFYRTTYEVGATEMQYMRPWKYVEDVVCTEVEPIEVIVKRWKPVEVI
ncbi:MAG: hypothetical protein Q8910_04295 [Bacteroidota bacterium]|nr:hypothetical protein [Bacteroidota bacterium]